MPFNRVIESLDIIQKLSDMPNEDDDLSAEELKKMFDKGVNLLKEYVFAFLDELEGKEAADKIGYNGAHSTIGAAVKALEAAGVGTIPPDNTITQAKLQNGCVTELKLAAELLNKVNAIKIKCGTITPTYTGDTTKDEGTSQYLTANKWQEFDIGFAPSAVILFKSGNLNSRWIPVSSTGNIGIRINGLATGQVIERDTSSYTRNEYEQYGGVAMINSPCMCNQYEVFKIDGTKIKTHLFTYNDTENSNVDKYDLGTTDTLYYIAIA